MDLVADASTLVAELSRVRDVYSSRIGDSPFRCLSTSGLRFVMSCRDVSMTVFVAKV